MSLKSGVSYEDMNADIQEKEIISTWHEQKDLISAALHDPVIFEHSDEDESQGEELLVVTNGR